MRVEDYRQRLTSLDVEAMYEAFDRQGLHYGPSFRGVGSMWTRPGEALGTITATIKPEAIKDVTVQLTMVGGKVVYPPKEK